MNKALKGLAKIGLILFFVIVFPATARAEVEAPKITKLTAQEFLSLNGAVAISSEVLVYVDGVFFGWAEIVGGRSDEADGQIIRSWRYDSAQKLSEGTHVVMAVAQDKTSLVLSAPTNEIKFTINVTPAPTLLAPNEKTATGDLRPLIVGLTKDKTLVKIFIDDVFNGRTDILRSDSGTADFVYRPVFNLNRGFHKIYALAQDEAGRESPKSEVLNFKIELPLPAPTLFKPVVNSQASLSRPFIVGLAKNNCKIKIYIDKKYNGELVVKNHPSGTADFAYKPTVALSRGEHLFYAVAVDKRGKQSIWSNSINFSTKKATIAESAQEERQGAVVNIEEPKKLVEIQTEPVVISSQTGAAVAAEKPTSGRVGQEQREQAEKMVLPQPRVESESLEEKQKAIKQELAEKERAALEKALGLAGTSTRAAESRGGMLNEGKQNQGKLKVSIILFVTFLVGVVAWLLWVNRELVKERRAQNEVAEKKEEKAEEGKNVPPAPGQENKLF
jgi:hypothetical protein